jgi:hypothetical protein
VASLLATAPAYAQETAFPPKIFAPAVDQNAALASGSEAWLQREAPASTGRGVLVPLYASFAALQMLDAHSTLRAVRAGGVEQNPMLRGIADKPVAMVALKAGVAASTIALAEKVRSRSRVGAIVLMAALNSTYAAVVVHNYRTIP